MQSGQRLYERKRTYEEWMEKEGIPIYKAIAGVEDITELPRRPWARMGGYGTFIQIEGATQAGKLLYVAEIPAGGALEPEKHLYDELIYILRGRGLSEVWHVGGSKRSFEWGEGSLFAIPTNAWHRLVNGGREPVLFYAGTNAPTVMEAFGNTEFIFNCDYNFTDRYTGQADYFQTSEKRSRVELRTGETRGTLWETNFVPDVRTVVGDYVTSWKTEGDRRTYFQLAGWASSYTIPHISEWPVGTYQKAHCHGPGAILLGLKSVGYVLVWSSKYGIHPFQDGHGDKVVKMNWKPGSIYSPYGESGFGDSWHQHFNTGPEPARHLKATGTFRTFSQQPMGVGDATISVRNGGRLIEYEDEDPEIRRMFKEELRQKGIECTLKPVVYRTDPFELSM